MKNRMKIFGLVGIVFVGILIATTIFGAEKSSSPMIAEEMDFVFHLNFSSLSKLYDISLRYGDSQNQLFSLTGIIKLYETTYNSNLETKIVKSTDAGFAYARRWLLFEKLGQTSNSEKDFIMSNKLLRKRYGTMDKESLKNLISAIDNNIKRGSSD